MAKRTYLEELAYAMNAAEKYDEITRTAKKRKDYSQSKSTGSSGSSTSKTESASSPYPYNALDPTDRKDRSKLLTLPETKKLKVGGKTYGILPRDSSTYMSDQNYPSNVRTQMSKIAAQNQYNDKRVRATADMENKVEYAFNYLNDKNLQNWDEKRNGNRLYINHVAPYRNLTEKERDTYNALYMESHEKANRWLESLTDELDKRNLEENLEKHSGGSNKLGNIKTAFDVGVDKAVTGMVKGVGDYLLGNEAVDKKGEREQYYEHLRSNAGDVEGALYDLALNVGNMTPSIMLGTLTGGAGAVVSKAASLGSMTAGIIGNTYQDTIEEGYGVDESRKYALASGISEGATEYILGGIAGVSGRFLSRALGGKLGKLATNAAKEGLAKYAREYGLDMLSEGTQEYVQELLDKGMRNLFLGESNPIKLTDSEAWYSALLGAASAGVLNIPNTAANIANDRAVKRYADSGGLGSETSYSDIVDSVDTDSESYTDSEGNVNEEALKQAEKVRDTAKSFGDREAAGETISNRERAELQYEIDELTRLAGNAEARGESAEGKVSTEEPALNTVDGEPTENELSREVAVNEGEIKHSEPDILNDLAREMGNPSEPREVNSVSESTVEAPNNAIQLPERNISETAAYAQSVNRTTNESFVEPDLPVTDDEVSAGNRAVFPEYVDQFSAKLSDAATEKMVAGYDGNVPMEKYLAAYRRMYTAGRNNIPQTTAERTALRMYLRPEQITEAYKLGAQDRYTAMRQAPEYDKGTAREGGLDYVSELATDAQRKVAEHIGKKTGLKIRIDENITGQAEYNSNEGTITISPNADNFNASLGHELTHFIQDYDRKSYIQFKNVAIEALMESDNISYDDLVEKYERAYLDSGNVASLEEITDEIAADAAGRFLNDEEFINKVVNKDRSLAQKIRDFFEDIADAIKSLIDTKSLRGAARALYEKNEAKYRTAAGLWNNGLVKASESYRDGNTLRQSTDSKYQLNEFGLNEFSDKEKKSWKDNPKIVICNTKADIENFIKDIMSKGLKVHKAAYLGRIGEDVAERILSDTGYDIHGYRIVVDTEGLQHALTHHGNRNKEASRGQIDVTAEMFADIPEIIQKYDRAIAEPRDGKKAIKFEKIIDNKITVLTLISEKKTAIRAEDMWQNNKKRAYTPSQDSANATSAHVQNVKGHGSFESKISQTGGKVKKQLDLNEDNSVDNKALIEQNNTLKQANEYLISQLTNGKKYIPSRTDISKIAGELIKETDSHYSKDVLTDKLTTLYSYIHDSDYIDGAELSSVAADLAGEILSRSGAGYDEYQIKAYNDLTSYLRKTNIKIPESYRGDFDIYGGYNEFRKKYFGTINLRSNGQAVDQVYSELSDRFPEYFSPDIINPADQVTAIADAIEAMRPTPVNSKMPEADYREQSYLLGQEIYQKYFYVKFKEGNGTTADKDLYSKYSASIRKYKTQLRQQYRESFLEVKRKSDAKIKELSNRYKAASQEEKANLRAKMDALRNDKNQRLYIQQEKYRKKISDTRDFYKGQRYKSMIIKDVTELGKWLSEPTDKRHVPDMLRKPLAEFLSDIDFSSNNLNQQGEPTQRTVKWQDLQATYARILQNDGIVEGDNGSQYIDIDPDIVERMGELKEAIQNIDKLDNLDAHTLEEVKNVVQSMKHSITDANRMIENKRYENVAEIANKSIGELSNLKDKSSNAGTVAETADKLMNNQMLDSYTRFYTFGPAAQTIYSELREGFNRKIKNTQEAENYIEKLKKDNNITTKDIQRWSGINAETIKYKTDRGEEIELKPSQVMSLYALMQRGQARKHILQGGVRPARTVVRRKINRFATREIDISTSKNIRLTQNDVVKLVDKLSPEQKAMADGITKFFTNVTSRWGNEVSMKMYGYTKFNARNYFPIVSDKSFLTTKTEDIGRNTQALKNMGFTKSTTPNAANPLILEDIFDVYTRQADQMGSYNAFVIPLSDMQKWYNYKLKGYEGSVKQEIERVFGNDAVEYIKKLMEDINGVGGNDQYFAAPLVSKFKASAVGFNLRVAIQQPTAYIRAAAEINPKYLISGLSRIPEKGKWDLIKKYSPIAQWKDWGNFEISTGRSMKNILLGNQSLSENLRDKQMWLAGKGDEVTWIRLWQAVEAEVKDKNRELTPGTDAFYEKVGERFDQIIDSTQVIDSVLHRSDIMRSSNDLNKMTTAFMSEPTKSYNMLYRSYFDFLKADKPNKIKTARKIGKTAMIFTLSSAATAAASAVISAMRDDEDKKYSEKYAEAFVDDFVGNVNPVNMLPFIKDIASIFEGYDVTRSDMTAVQEFKWTYDKWKKYVEGDSTDTVPGLIVYSLKPISSITGIAFDNIARDFDAAWNTFIGGLLPADVEYTKTKTFDADLGNTRNLSVYVPMILDAYKNGNDELAERIISDLEENDIAREKIEEKISSMLSADERIGEAAQALADKDTGKYVRLKEELISEGYDSELVETKIHNKLDSLKPYTYTEIAAAADSPEEFGRMADEIRKYKIAEGQTDDDIIRNIRSQVTKKYKPLYIEAYENRDEAEMQDIRKKLGSLKVYGKKLYGANYNFSKEWLD